MKGKIAKCLRIVAAASIVASMVFMGVGKGEVFATWCKT